jgi:hypothetical protein
LYKRTLINYLIYDMIISLGTILITYYQLKNNFSSQLIFKTLKIMLMKFTLFMYYLIYIPKHHTMRLSEY